MIAAEDAILILLAAGRSARFGDADKLEQEFLGKPVGMHVVTALEGMPFRERIAVVDGCALDFAGRDFHVIHNGDAATGMAGSIRLGVARAQELGAAAVVIALADMPRVTASHVYHLLDAADSPAAVVASSDGVQPRPPALFGRERFEFLLGLTGEEGARELIRAGRHVVTTPAELTDIDTPEDLERLRASVRTHDLAIRAAGRRSD